MSIEDQLKHGKITIMRHEDIRKCPHRIMVPRHYNEDGSCKCFDPDATEMKAWGYVWQIDHWINEV